MNFASKRLRQGSLKAGEVVRLWVILLPLAVPVALAAEDLPVITIEGDRFLAAGREFKIWGFNAGHGLHLTDDQLDRMVDHLAFLGVNLLRLHTIDWTLWGEQEGPRGEPLDAGLLPHNADSTRRLVNADKFYRLLDKLRAKGIYVAITLSVARNFRPGDADVIKTDDADARAWAEAVAELNGMDDHVQLRVFKVLPAVDERSLALRKEFASALLTLRRPKTGVKLAEDPQLALFNTVNESSCLKVFYRGDGGGHLPKYFMDKVIRHWNGYLRDKYGSDPKVAEAWNQPGLQGLLSGESLEKDNVALLPMHPSAPTTRGSAETFSEARRRDVVEFLVRVDLRHQREMVNHYRSLGWTRPCIYSDSCGYDGETGPVWLKTDLLPYVEDHPYDKPKIDLFYWGWLKLPQYFSSSFLDREGTDRPHWASEINHGNGEVGEGRIAFPLFVAVYYSLQGRDGAAFHAWGMKREHVLLAPERTNTLSWANCGLDVPWLYMYRAAGRLFTSCEIRPLERSDGRLDFSKSANITTDQVYRVNGEKGCLRVQTDHFRVLAAPKPRREDFTDLTIDLTSDTLNVVVVEKLSDSLYEVTAVGRSGDFKDAVIRFEPLEFVSGSVTFKDRAIGDIEHINHLGEVIERVTGDGSQMPLVYGIRLYRVRLVNPAGPLDGKG